MLSRTWLLVTRWSYAQGALVAHAGGAQQQHACSSCCCRGPSQCQHGTPCQYSQSPIHELPIHLRTADLHVPGTAPPCRYCLAAAAAARCATLRPSAPCLPAQQEIQDGLGAVEHREDKPGNSGNCASAQHAEPLAPQGPCCSEPTSTQATP